MRVGRVLVVALAAGSLAACGSSRLSVPAAQRSPAGIPSNFSAAKAWTLSVAAGPGGSLASDDPITGFFDQAGPAPGSYQVVETGDGGGVQWTSTPIDAAAPPDLATTSVAPFAVPDDNIPLAVSEAGASTTVRIYGSSGTDPQTTEVFTGTDRRPPAVTLSGNAMLITGVDGSKAVLLNAKTGATSPVGALPTLDGAPATPLAAFDAPPVRGTLVSWPTGFG